MSAPRDADRPKEFEIVAAKLELQCNEYLGRPTHPVVRAAARLYDDPSLPWPLPPEAADR